VLSLERSWRPGFPKIFLSSRPRYLCWDFCALHFAWRNRYASITLGIIVLIPRSNAAWIVALHRFFEVSVGILVALALVAVWPEHQAESAKRSAE